MFRALWLLGALEAARASETASETCSVEHWMSTFEAGGTLPLHCCGAEIGPVRGWYGILRKCEPGSACEANACDAMERSGWAPAGYLSQFGQDQWLREAIFGGRRDGVFVELGGYDAVVASNTWFYERCRGWTGVVIEPQAPRHAGFLRLRPNASLAPHCVSDVPGEQVTFVSLPGGTGLAGVESASLEDAIDRLDKRGRAAIVKDTKTCHRVASILARRRVTHVDFFSLDCEGCELKAVRSIDFDAVTVDVFTIEQSAAGVAAAKFLVDERNYVNVGRLSADVVLVRGDLRMPCAARAPLPSRFAKLPAFPDAQKLAAAAAAEGSGHSRDAVERAREIAGPLDRPVAYDAVDRPNLVLVVLDDASPDMFPDAYPEYASEAWQSARYGSPKTPSIAALAREGAAFRAAYAPALCGPSRASLLTGRYPSETGYLHNQLRMASPAAAAAHALLPALLKGAGYATAMAGKWGVGPSKQGIPGDLAAARFDTYLMHDAGLSEHNAKDCGGDAHVDARVANPLATTTYLSRYWAPCYRRFPPDPATDSPLGYVRTTRADFGPDLEEQFVATFLGKQTPATPFFLYYPTVLVHETENRTLPRADAPGDNGLKPTTDRLRPGGYWLARMKRLVERADVAVGKLRGALAANGQRPSTIVWVVSDNAAAYRGKGRGVERGASVVSVVAGPGVRARGAVDGLMDSTCLFPTLLDFASVTHDRPRSLAAYLRGARNDVGFRFVAAEIGGSRVIRANGTLLEASNGLLGVAPGRLYATTGFSPADGVGYERCLAGDESRACEEARLDVARAAAELPESPQRGDAYFATPAGQKFLAFHEFEAMEHLSSPPWYKRKDERSDPACPSPLGFCPRNNSAGRAVDFMNTYGLPVLRPEADADRALLVLVASPRVGSTLLERLLDAAPDTTMHNECFHWNDTQFGACGPNGGKYSHFSPKLRGACPPAAAFAARHETPAPLLAWATAAARTAASGFKLMPGHIRGVNNVGAPRPGALVDAVRAAGPFAAVVFVTLRRRCAVAQFLSLQRAMRTGGWGQSTAPSSAVAVDVAALEAHVAGEALYERTVASALATLQKDARNVAALDLFYEDDLSSPAAAEDAWRRVRAALRLPMVDATPTMAALHARHRRRRAPLREAVSNWAALPAALRDACTSEN